jgi:hypothetical protein
LSVQKHLRDTARSLKRDRDTMNPGAGDVGGNPLPPEPVPVPAPVPEITDYAATDEDDNNQSTGYIDALQCFHDDLIERIKNPLTKDDVKEMNRLFQLFNVAFQTNSGAME